QPPAPVRAEVNLVIQWRFRRARALVGPEAYNSRQGERPMDSSDSKLNRREFLQKSAAVAAGSAAMSGTALSYSRIVGANDRISLGHIGIGNRGTELDWIAGRLKDKHNVEMTAVCDLWTVNREKASARNEKYYSRAPRKFEYLEDLLALKDVDA